MVWGLPVFFMDIGNRHQLDGFCHELTSFWHELGVFPHELTLFPHELSYITIKMPRYRTRFEERGHLDSSYLNLITK